MAISRREKAILFIGILAVLIVIALVAWGNSIKKNDTRPSRVHLPEVVTVDVNGTPPLDRWTKHKMIVLDKKKYQWVKLQDEYGKPIQVSWLTNGVTQDDLVIGKLATVYIYNSDPSILQITDGYKGN